MSAGLVDDRTFGDHENPVCEFEEFVEILGDEQYRGAGVADAQDLVPDLGDGREIEPEAGIAGHQQTDLAFEFAGQDQPLHVTARQRRQWRG